MKYLNKTIIALAAIALSVSMTSCDDFLDVRSENTAKEDDLFKSYKGFRDALTGAYMLMAGESGYGQNLTMTHVDALTQQWWCTSSHEDEFPLLYQLTNHDYTNDEAKSSISGMYLSLFKAIAQANVVAKQCEENGSAITNSHYRATIQGEALAIRAYCQLDVLRLFGQMPQGGSKQVKLPYSFCTGVSEMPEYYSYSDYFALLEKDLDAAIALMKDNDPVVTYGFNNEVEDEFFLHREMRLNYYAVLALKCRFLLYTGKTTEAHNLALEIINAQANGAAVKTLSGNDDLKAINNQKKAFYALPSECFFMLSKHDILKAANNVLYGYHVGDAEVRTEQHMVFTEANWTKLYASLGNIGASNNRYLNCWGEGRNGSQKFRATLKYWYSTEISAGSMEAIYANEYFMYKQQIIPMIRMSEIYLIAIETSQTVDEANRYYTDYIAGCGIPASVCPQFESLEDMKAEILNEYQREFVAEGQSFYAYKRTATRKMMFGTTEMTEDEYIIPLPETEYDPALSR